MKTKLISLFLVILFVFCTVSVFAAGYGGKVIYKRGYVIKKSLNGIYRPVRVGMLLRNSDIIKTGSSGYCVVQLTTGSKIKVFRRSTFELSAILNKNKSFNLKNGSVLVNAAKIKRRFRISTPTAVAGVRGTTFSVQYYPDKNSCRISVKEGKVAVKRNLIVDLDDNVVKEKVEEIVNSEVSLGNLESVEIKGEVNKKIENFVKVNKKAITEKALIKTASDLKADFEKITEYKEIKQEVVLEEKKSKIGDLTDNNVEIVIKDEEKKEPEVKKEDKVEVKPDEVKVEKKFQRIFWKYDIKSSVKTSLVLNGSKLIFYDKDNTLYCIDVSVENGKQLWVKKFDSKIDTVPVIADDKIFLGTNDGNFYAYNLNTGNEIWKGEFGSVIFQVSAAYYKGVVYIGSSNKSISAVDAKTGKLLWSKSASSGIYSTPIVYNNALFVGSEDSYLYAFDITNKGELLWKKSLNKLRITSTIPIAIDNKVICKNQTGDFFCFDATSGKQLWTKNYGSTYSIPIQKEGYFYITANSKLLRIKVEDGSIVWSKDYKSNNLHISGNNLYISNNEKVVSLSLEGKVNWEMALKSENITKVVADGNAIYVVADGKLYKLNPAINNETSEMSGGM